MSVTAGIGFLVFGGLPASGQTYPTARWYDEPQYEPPEHQVDMQHMRLEIQFVPAEGLVRGTVTHRFVPLRATVDSLFLHGPGIRVNAVSYNGRTARFSSTDDGVIVRLAPAARWGETDSVTLQYEANPQRGLFFIGWNDSTGASRKQIWSQGQGINNRHWIPCYDEQNDKLTTETIVTFDSRFSVLSNGTRVSNRRNADGTTTWHYRMSHPHSLYLVMLGIGTYAVQERQSRSGVPLHLWYYPEYPERIEPTYRYSAEAVDFLAEETGVPYPWESYAQIPVQDFMHGAMENTTATLFGDFYLVDQRSFLDKNYIRVNVHELTHQWFGNFITGRVSRNSWLHESFATFYPKLFLRRIEGEDAYQWARKLEHDAAREAAARDRFPILHSRAGSDRVYEKGSAVLDMMRYTFGEDAIRRVVTHYLKAHAYGLVETNDLYQAFQDVLGLSPRWFFEEWIYRGGEPQYAITHEDITIGSKRQTRITVRQTHERDELVGLFRMPVVFAVHYADGSMDTARVMVERESQSVDIPNPRNKPVDFVLFDPGNWILKTVSYPRPFAELEAQASRAPQMIDRYDAAAAMRDIDPGTKRASLCRLYRQERFGPLRAEAVTQLVNDPHEDSRALVRQAIQDPAVEVRSAVASRFNAVPPEERGLFERLLTDSSYEIVALSLRKLTAQFPAETDRYLAMTASDRGVGNAVRILWHEIRAGRGVEASLDSLARLAAPASEFQTRVNAFEALCRLNHLDAGIVRSLCDAMTHPNGRLRGPATGVARKFLEQSAHKTLFRRVVESETWPEEKRKVLWEVVGDK
jgi:aminopeptidase N